MTRLDEDLFDRIKAFGQPDDDDDDADAFGAHITERIASIVAPLEAERDQLLAERDACRAYASRIDAQLRRCDRVLSAARVAIDPPAPKAKATGRATKGASEERLEIVRAAIEAADDPVTSVDLRELTGLNKSATETCIRILRERGVVRRAGYAENRQGKAPGLYALMPREEVVA